MMKLASWLPLVLFGLALIGCGEALHSDPADLEASAADLVVIVPGVDMRQMVEADLSSPTADLVLTTTDLAAPPPDLATRPADLTVRGVDVSDWTLYTIAVGAHSATIKAGPAGAPRAGLVRRLAGRAFDFVFDPSAKYTITKPVQPPDQFDWNKLPGISDCNQFDLSRDGVMFGWRWRLDTMPRVLEVTAYANNAGVHLTPKAPLFTLDAADLASMAPLRYRYWMDGGLYRFTVKGTIRGRMIDVSTTLPRRCANMAPGSLVFQWAAGFYFGGTSTAPSVITGRIFELPFP